MYNSMYSLLHVKFSKLDHCIAISAGVEKSIVIVEEVELGSS